MSESFLSILPVSFNIQSAWVHPKTYGPLVHSRTNPPASGILKRIHKGWYQLLLT